MRPVYYDLDSVLEAFNATKQDAMMNRVVSRVEFGNDLGMLLPPCFRKHLKPWKNETHGDQQRAWKQVVPVPWLDALMGNIR